MPPLPPASSVWNHELLANPHAVSDKPARVRQMFAAIAPSYDLNNRLHSLWVDQYWRRQAVVLADVKPTDRVLDVACGTGDLTLRFAKEILDRRGGLSRRDGNENKGSTGSDTKASDGWAASNST